MTNVGAFAAITMVIGTPAAAGAGVSDSSCRSSGPMKPSQVKQFVFKRAATYNDKNDMHLSGAFELPQI